MASWQCCSVGYAFLYKNNFKSNFCISSSVKQISLKLHIFAKFIMADLSGNLIFHYNFASMLQHVVTLLPFTP